MNPTLRWWLAATAMLLSSVGCKKPAGPYEITQVRDLDPGHAYEQPTLTTSSAKRFGYETRPTGDQDQGGKGQLVWEAPEGWTEVPSTAMRDANMRFGPQQEGECYLTRLPSGGGGLAANVNRWRKQMGQPPIGADEVAALPTRQLLGFPATLVSLQGTFTGMGAAPKENHGLHGLILELGGGALFVKMTGPSDLVTANETQFDAFCQSLNVSTGR